MNNLDRYIIDDLSPDIELPQSYHDIISNTLKNKQLRKRYRLKKLIHIIISIISSIFLTSGMVFAGYTVYEKVWKEPTIYNTIEEKISDDKDFYEESNINNLKENIIISNKEAIYIVSNIFSNLGIDEEITEKNIKVNEESFSQHFEIQTEKFYVSINSNGDFQNLINNNFNYTFKSDIITENEAIMFANNIIENIGLGEQYSLKYIEDTNSFKNGNKSNIWFASYYQTINGLKNKYNCINLSFRIRDNNVEIEKIITLDNNFKFDNNEIILNKTDAIKIAKEVDRRISILEITSMEAELEIERLNSFIYIQEQSLGKDDEHKEQIIDGNSHSYNAYSNDRILRIVWNVRINYDYNNINARNDKERFGRNYYVDATTGEIIGGSWGN